MFITVRFDDNQILKIETAVGTIEDSKGEKVPNVASAVFQNKPDSDEILDHACYITVAAVEGALLHYFSKQYAEEDVLEPYDHSATEPE
ncbi:MAG: hypothetical protein KUF72_17970 [Candidatus Thiodiazotropha sp. (ex Ctena orbiculata)]|nr:hypothetical protein [Candidatus Thiodiazotropha taylori]